MAPSTSSGKRLRLTVFLIKDTYPAVEDFVSVAQTQRSPRHKRHVEGDLVFQEWI